MALYRLIWKRFIQCVWMPVVFVAALIFVGVYLFLSFQTDSYQMIFSVNRQFTRAQKCKPTVYILPSEYTPAGGVPTEF